MAPTHIGRYRVEGSLGAGGVGLVFAAHDPVLGRRVAVKLLRPGRLGVDAERAGQRLREEAQAMARLAHPNVAAVFDVGEHEGGVYIAMELVEGLSLRDWLAETARPWREVLSVYFQAGRGLAAAHDAGLVHRDFKPANVLVGRDGRVRVVDFGLASARPSASTLPHVASDDVELTAQSGLYHQPSRLTEVERTVDESGARAKLDPGSSSAALLRGLESAVLTNDALHTLVGPDLTVEGNLLQTMPPDPGATQPGLTPTGMVAGTPAYMAPELFLGRPADARSDQFSFCVALYEGLYGRRPFAGDTAVAIAEEVLAGRVLPPPRRTRVPRWIHAIIEQGLSLPRQERHPSVRSMLASIAFLARVVWN
jgi:eukaryotic-like serine/threonine-protein kinase